MFLQGLCAGTVLKSEKDRCLPGPLVVPSILNYKCCFVVAGGDEMSFS